MLHNHFSLIRIPDRVFWNPFEKVFNTMFIQRDQINKSTYATCKTNKGQQKKERRMKRKRNAIQIHAYNTYIIVEIHIIL